MKWRRLLLLVVVPTTLAVPARAGIFFNRKAKPDPAERVPALILTLKTESSEHRRASAASELRQFSPNAFPEVVPALVDAALHDPKAGVRLDAVESLGHLRPVSQQAGWALEQVLAHEGNIRVRLEARSSLWQYHLSGYRGANHVEPPVAATETVTTAEPPLDTTANAPPAAPPPAAQPPVRPVPVMTPASAPESVPAQPVTAIPLGRPMPAGPPQPPVTPAEPPLLQTPPPSDGPDLTPPQ